MALVLDGETIGRGKRRGDGTAGERRGVCLAVHMWRRGRRRSAVAGSDAGLQNRRRSTAPAQNCTGTSEYKRWASMRPNCCRGGRLRLQRRGRASRTDGSAEQARAQGTENASVLKLRFRKQQAEQPDVIEAHVGGEIQQRRYPMIALQSLSRTLSQISSQRRKYITRRTSPPDTGSRPLVSGFLRPRTPAKSGPAYPIPVSTRSPIATTTHRV